MKPPDPNHPDDQNHGTFWMLLSVILFSANTLIIQAVGQSSPLAQGWTATLYRGLFGILLVTALYAHRGSLSWKSLVCQPLVVARGIIGALSIVAFYLTIAHLGSSRAVVINLTYPLFATLMAATWLKEKIRPAAFAWMLVGFIGLVIFLDVSHGSLHFWDLIGLLGAVGAGIVVVMIRQLRHLETPGTIYASQCLYSLLLALPLGASSVSSLPPIAHLGLIAAALVVGASQLVMTHAFRSLPVARGTSIQMLLPIVTATGAWLIFGNSLSPTEITGASLTLLATWKVTTTP